MYESMKYIVSLGFNFVGVNPICQLVTGIVSSFPIILVIIRGKNDIPPSVENDKLRVF
jgi:hypothetical protein